LTEVVSGYFDGKILLISGGTGSFGRAVLKRLLNSNIKEIRVFSRDEKKQDDMRKLYQSDKLRFYIGDVRDYQSILAAMRGVDFVYHAAALKQVPSCEFHPLEAVKTNILGTENILEAGINCSVSRIVCLSTDKAVYPINAMGISKAMMEKIVVAKARIASVGTTICATRYGNVMSSRGSVIPLFIEQISANRPISVTDPEMTRYMMTLDDAVNLVLYAFENGINGDIFVKKAPAASIDVLAKALLKILKKEGHQINVIGTRHGEKLYETLCSREEMLTAVDEGEYYRIPADSRNLNYEKYFVEGSRDLSHIQDYNSHTTERLSLEQMQKLLLNLNFVKNFMAEKRVLPNE